MWPDSSRQSHLATGNRITPSSVSEPIGWHLEACSTAGRACLPLPPLPGSELNTILRWRIKFLLWAGCCPWSLGWRHLEATRCSRLTFWLSQSLQGPIYNLSLSLPDVIDIINRLALIKMSMFCQHFTQGFRGAEQSERCGCYLAWSVSV